MHAYTEVAGLVESDATWTLAESPIRLTGSVTVNPGVTLTIEPGVTVDIWEYDLDVKGALNATGTSENKIIITTSIYKDSGLYANNPLPEELRFDPVGTGSTIENTNITERVVIDCSIKVTKSSLQDFVEVNDGSSIFSGNDITGQVSVFNGSSTFTNNKIEVIDVLGGTPTIASNNINTLAIYGGTPTVTNNTVQGAASAGPISFYHKPESPILSGNKFLGSVSVSGSTVLSGNEFIYGLAISDGPVTVTNNTFNSAYNNTIITVSGIGTNISNNRIIGINNDPFDLSKHGRPPRQIGISIGAEYGQNSSAAITGNYIEHCQIAIDVFPSSIQICKNVISNNYCGISIASQLVNPSDPNPPTINTAIDIHQNNISNNSIGIEYLPYKSPANITNNDIYGNVIYNFKLMCSNDTNVADNWWGTTDYGTISQSIYDRQDNNSLGKVTFSSILTGPYAQSPSTLNLQSPIDSNTLIIVLVVLVVVILFVIGIVLALNKKIRKNKG